MQGDNITTVVGFSTVEVVQYIRGITSVLWGITSVLWKDNISTVEGYLQYMWGIASVLWGIPSVLWRLFSTVGDNISTVGIASVLWRVISRCRGITSVHAGG